MNEDGKVHEPEVVEEDTLDLRRPDVPITLEEIAALGIEGAETIIQARVQIIKSLRAASIRQTHPSDWVLYKDANTGRVLAFLEDKGCQRLMDLWGIEIRNITTPTRENSEDGASYAYTIMGDGFCKVTQRIMDSVEGVRYSTEHFATEKPEGIQREVAVKKAARANLEGRIVRNLAGLNGVPLEELVLLSGDKEFERKATKGRGYGTQAQRAGAQVQESAEIEAQYQPKCEVCHSDMKFVPGGTSQKGKPYDAFWGCKKDREHRPTVPHAQALAEAKRMKADAEKRQPGEEE